MPGSEATTRKSTLGVRLGLYGFGGPKGAASGTSKVFDTPVGTCANTSEMAKTKRSDDTLKVRLISKFKRFPLTGLQLS